MFGDIEEIHCARQVKIAIGIELAGKFCRMGLEITLNLEVDAERIAAFAFFGDSLAAKSLLPLARRAVTDHAELARQTHSQNRPLAERIVAAVPVRIATNDLTLQ